MTTFLWIAALVCWGVAAALIFSVAYPHLFTAESPQVPQGQPRRD
jgi:hypothetical protein